VGTSLPAESDVTDYINGDKNVDHEILRLRV
jgi:hypothetical protein